MCFNSLQTGKRIASEYDYYYYIEQWFMFQFPSNGKVYPKTIPQVRKMRKSCVSIPFKRESISKGISMRREQPLAWRSFNSLQTGKHIQRHSNLSSVSTTFLRFNSLQTGKHIQSRLVEPSDVERLCEFQFPSNGKAYPKMQSHQRVDKLPTSSFNSLQTGKHIQR